MDYITNLFTPQLDKIHSGKVRESFRVDDQTRLIVATDRISSFDEVLETPIPGKGSVLNSLAAYWFEETRDIIGNHFIRLVDPSVSLVREAVPIRVEMIVRGYITGSAWRAYQNGRREVSGVPLPDGMKKNQAFAEPIVTPTTKEESDREISAADLVKEGWLSEKHYREMERASLALFRRGSEMLAERGIILVDTKYEFGLLEGELILIDELHTPDSSRFWRKDDYEKDPDNVEQLDKEYVRQHLLAHKKDGAYPRQLPADVVKETSRRYREIFKMITGKEAPDDAGDAMARLYRNLVSAELIKDGYVVMIMGSPADEEHAAKIRSCLDPYGIFTQMRVVSAHKNGEDLPAVVRDYNRSIEPGAIIAIAGRSNGLGGALSANVSVPVINCPPFADKTDLLVNINSSLMMPSGTPALTVIDPKNAALAALRVLNIRRLRDRLRRDIAEMKQQLQEADRVMRKK